MLLESPLGLSLVRLQPQHRRALLLALQAVSPTLPEVSDVNYSLSVLGNYEEFEYQIKLFPNSFVGVQYFYGAISFVPQWANPVWEILNVDVSSEESAILSRLRTAMTELSRASWLSSPLAAELMDDSALILLPWWRQRLWWLPALWGRA